MATPLEAAVEQLRKSFEAYALGHHRPDLERQLARIVAAGPTLMDRECIERLQRELAPYLEYHKRQPYLVAPASAIEGEITVARQLANDARIGISMEGLSRHLLLVGMTGAGKTTGAQNIAQEAQLQGVHLVIIDPKRDARRFPVENHDMLVLHDEAPLAFFETPSFLSPEQHTALFVKSLVTTLYGGEGLTQIATEAITKTRREHDHPSLNDLLTTLRTMNARGDTFTRRDRIDGLTQRLTRFAQRYPGWANTKAGSGIPIDLVGTCPWHFGFETHTEIEDFITTYLLELRFACHRHNRTTQPTTLALIDEALLLLHDHGIKHEPAILSSFPLYRQYRLAVLFTANTFQRVPPLVVANTYTKVILNLTDHRDTSAVSQMLGLNREQEHFLDKKLSRGQAIVRFSDGWREPLLATLDAPRTAKDATDEEWQEAKNRTDRRSRTPRPTTIESAKPQESPTPIEERPIPTPGTGLLNRNERALLHYILEHEPILISEAITDIPLHPQQAARALKKLMDLQLASTEPIIARRGRGGKANAISATNHAATLLDTSRMRQSRGQTSAQHRFLATRIAQRIEGAQIEVDLNGKSVDILVMHATAQRLVPLIARLANQQISLRDGELIAIEIETSDPAKTALVNITKNRERGVALTVIATITPLLVQRLSAPDVIVLDAIELLAALQEASP